MNEQPEISFLIVNWNGGETFKNALRSIDEEAAHAGISSYEIVVVDNNSKDLPEDFLGQIKNLRLIKNDSNRLFAAATNQTVAAAKGEYLFILNNDIVLRPGCLKALLQPLKDDPEVVGVTAPQLRYPDGRIQPSITGLPRPSDVFYATFFLDRFSARFGHWLNARFDYTKPQLTDGQPMFSAILLPREVWKKVGNMDENFPLLWNDVDWFYRFNKTGLKVKFVPSAVVTHIHGMSVNRHPYRKIWTSTTAMYKFFRKSYQSNIFQDFGLVLLCGLTLALRFLREVALNLKRAISR